MLRVKSLTKIYPGKNPVKAITNINFEIKKGELVGLLGPNGAGKTTTIKCILGLIEPTSGKVFVNGIDMIHHTQQGLQYVSGLLEGNRNIYWRLTVKENLEFFGGIQGIPLRENREYIDYLIEFFNLKEKIKSQARFLSRGMQQKLAVACALARRTDIVLLDEPTLGLDVESTYEMRELISKLVKKENRTVLLSTHDMKTVERVCSRVIIINKGKLVTDDKITNLKALFRVTAYKIECRGNLPSEIRTRIENEFIAHIDEHDDKIEIDVDLREPERLYNLMELLRESNIMLESLENKTPDFEEVFLRIVQSER